MKSEHEKWLLIQRYVTGNTSAEDRQRVENWSAESHENRRLMQELRQIWKQTQAEEFDVDVQHAWEQFQYRNLEKVKSYPSLVNNQNTFKRNKTGILFKAVAGILVIIISTVFAYYLMNSFQETDSVQATAVHTLEEIATDPGERVSIKFSDGTKVMLNSASSIRFPKVFHGSKREVYLDGEAYFEVAHNPDQPFTVAVQDAEIEVLGTEFNVRGWAEDPSVEVVVNGGKVSVYSVADGIPPDSEVILTEGLRTRVERGQVPGQPHEVDSVRHILWTNGGIHFDRVPFYLVIRNLERQFNVEISVSVPSLLPVSYTGTFQDADLNEILEVIATSMEAGLRRDGSKIEFYR